MQNMIGTINHGYQVIAQMPDVSNDIDVYVTAEAVDGRRAQNYVTWATTDQYGISGLYAGHYKTGKAAALIDMARRAGLSAEVMK